MAKRTSKKTSRRRGAGGTGAGGGHAAAGAFMVHVLDMGTTMYGDCIVCRAGNRSILIDGGHLGDMNPKDGHASIPAQLEQLFGAKGPHHFDLLVMTHCHADHIGCLPAMVAKKVFTADMALVADPDLGWGRSGQDAIPVNLDERERRVLAAVREESVATMPAADLDEFLDAAVKLEDGYRGMLDTLAKAGTKVYRYTKPADAKKVEAALKDIGLKVHGPSAEHLKRCAAAIARIGRDSLDRLRTGMDASVDAADAARRALADPAIDMAGIGAALNDQSIVLSVEAEGKRVLLLGDMQLAKPELAGLEGEMTALLDGLKQAGPFHVVKTPHHTSYNGIDSKVLAAFADAKVWVHSGGSRDAGHPDASALKVLKALNAQAPGVSFARTDRHGLITIGMTKTQTGVKVSRGAINDFSINKADEAALPPAVAVTGPVSAAAVRAGGVSGAGGGVVEVRAFVPVGTRARITFEVESQGGPAGGGADFPPTAFRLANGRNLRPLLFVTDVARLRSAVGSFADECVSAARGAGHRVVDLAGEADPERACSLVRSANSDGAAGVVLLGGPTIVPARIVDTLPDDLRRQVQGRTDDPDDFFVWSDEPYGDRDGDLIAEVPVSRIPDGGSAAIMRIALSVGEASSGGVRAGYRNINRPFADGVYSGIRGSSPMVLSELATPETIGDDGVTGEVVYVMLHGSDSDGSRFWGETRDGRGLLALRPENIGQLPNAVVFTGCCWGAMAWSPIARRALDGAAISPRTPATSLAMRFLERGVRAFIGCTGAHYSPDRPPYNSAGGPMHQAFWQHLTAGKPPAQALFDAKADYVKWMSSTRQTPESLAVSFKILRQYTCLGLGW